ncbi:unnamed protein product [Spodoptera exigua]|nr:unnamed protein product [Spodoptera exigua]
MSLGKILALDKLTNFFNAIRQNGGIRASLFKLYRNRWVEYSDKVHMNYDGSQVSAEWFGWLHYKTDLPPHQDPSRPKYKWMADFTENMSGTTGQYVPYSTTRPKVEPWVPKKAA